MYWLRPKRCPLTHHDGLQALLRQMAVLGRRPGRKAKLLPAQVEQLPLEEVASLVATSRRLSSVLRRALRGIVRSASM